MADIPNRIVIGTKDVMKITGKSRRTACRILARIRKFYEKDVNGMVCIFEFCEVTKIKEAFVMIFFK